jgi:hypothetical protein
LVERTGCKGIQHYGLVERPAEKLAMAVEVSVAFLMNPLIFTGLEKA